MLAYTIRIPSTGIQSIEGILICLFFLSLNENKSVGRPAPGSLPVEGICNVRCAPAHDLIDSPKVEKGMREDLKN